METAHRRHRPALPSTIAALVAAMLLAVAADAAAAPQTFDLRVEGTTGTLFEGAVTSDGKVVDGGDGPVQCDGTQDPGQDAGPTPVSALVDAGLAWSGTTWGMNDYFVTEIAGDDGNGAWGVYRNFTQDGVSGGCSTRLFNGDEALFVADAWGPAPDFAPKVALRLTAPARARTGEPVTVRVVDGHTGAPVGGATVGGRSTGADGRATLVFDSPGVRRLKAERSGMIRSNSAVVEIVESVGAEAPPSARPPIAARLDLETGSVHPRGQGPRTISGTVAPMPAGTSHLDLRITRQVGGRCATFDGETTGFVDSGCGAERGIRFPVSVRPDGSFSYELPARLQRGRYVVDAVAVDRNGVRDGLERGMNRAVLFVGVSKLRSGAPRLHVLGLRDRSRLRLGPRELRGRVDPTTGVRRIRLSIRRRHAGRCEAWSPTRERFRRARCGRSAYFTVEGGESWSYLLPARLPRGRYVIDAVATDNEGFRDRLRRGRTRFALTVQGGPR